MSIYLIDRLLVPALYIKLLDRNISSYLRRKTAESAGCLLHAEQRKLVLEEEKVRQTGSRLTIQQQARTRLENENEKLKETLTGLELRVHAKLQDNDAGMERMNSAATRLLQVQMAKMKLENMIGVDQQHANKAEEDLKQIQGAKQVQDAYIMRLNDRMEQCTLQLEQCTTQTQSMEAATSETSENLMKAEGELRTVKAEEKKISSSWHGASSCRAAATGRNSSGQVLPVINIIDVI